MIVTDLPQLLLASGIAAPEIAAPGLLAASSRAPGRGLRSRIEKPPPLRKRELTRFLALAAVAAGVEGKVSVLLTDDEGIRQLNSVFRKKNTPTDVLSFPAAPPPPGQRTRRQSKLAGDLAISLTTAARQAAAFGHPLEVEVKILLLHGVLHLAGFDHECDGGEMARRECAMRKKLGLPPGLIARSSNDGKPAKEKATTKRSVKP